MKNKNKILIEKIKRVKNKTITWVKLLINFYNNN